MKYRAAGIIYNSMQNGEGVRNVIFFAGCKHRCPGCHNIDLWPEDSGVEKDIDEVVKEQVEQKDFIDGITISGGDPFFQYEALLEMCKKLKAEGFDIWVYTGYTFWDLIDKGMTEILNYIDALVDGKYINSRPKAKYRGSDNQIIWYFEKGKPTARIADIDGETCIIRWRNSDEGKNS